MQDESSCANCGKSLKLKRLHREGYAQTLDWLPIATERNVSLENNAGHRDLRAFSLCAH